MRLKNRIMLFIGIASVLCLAACAPDRRTATDMTAASELPQESVTAADPTERSSDPISEQSESEASYDTENRAEPEAPQESVTAADPTERSSDPISEQSESETSYDTENKAEKTMRLFIGDIEVSVKWEDNESVSALIDRVKTEPLVINMSMYGGFEQVGSLGSGLPRNDKQITTQAGDVVLYSGDQLVVFYGSNSWSYTRLGRITDRTAAELTDLLGNGNVTITILYGGQ